VSGGTVEEAHARLTKKVIHLEGIAGTAVGLHDGKPCIKVYLEKDNPELRARIPRAEGEYLVVLEATGRFRRL